MNERINFCRLPVGGSRHSDQVFISWSLHLPARSWLRSRRASVYPLRARLQRRKCSRPRAVPVPRQARGARGRGPADGARRGRDWPTGSRAAAPGSRAAHAHARRPAPRPGHPVSAPGTARAGAGGGGGGAAGAEGEGRARPGSARPPARGSWSAPGPARAAAAALS